MSDLLYPSNALIIIHNQIIDGVQPGEDTGHKLRLAVDGGGMAGVVSLGMLSVLEAEGYLQHFQGIDTISAGLMNGTAAVVGKIPEAKKLYIETLTNPKRKFVDPWRVGKPVDMDLLTGHIESIIDPEVIRKAQSNFVLASQRLSRAVLN